MERQVIWTGQERKFFGSGLSFFVCGSSSFGNKSSSKWALGNTTARCIAPLEDGVGHEVGLWGGLAPFDA